jgi:hypothetical protein
VDASPPRHVAASGRAALADDPLASEQFVQKVPVLLDLRAKAESVELIDRIISTCARQVGQLHENLSCNSQCIPGRGGSTGRCTYVDQVRSHLKRDHRAELAPHNPSPLAEDDHTRAPGVNEPANLDAAVMDHRGIRRRGDFEPNRLFVGVIAAPGSASAREKEQKHQTTGARGPSRVQQHLAIRLASA